MRDTIVVLVLVVGVGCHGEPDAETPDAETPEPDPARSFDTITIDDRGGCWLRDDGRVVCFGEQVDGSLGWGAPDSPRWAPRVVPGLDDVVQLVGRDYHRCALTRSGEVHCFGPWSRRSYQWTESPPRGARALETSKYRNKHGIADEHHFALDGEGRLLWAPPSPAEQTWQWVEGVEDGVELASVGKMICARTRGGEVDCFQPTTPPVPVAIAGIVAAVELTIATDDQDLWEHEPDGAIFVREADGTLHRLSRDPRAASPKAFRRDAVLDDVVALDRSCALRANGEVICFSPVGDRRPLKGVPEARAHLALDDGACVIAKADGAVHCVRGQDPPTVIPHLSPARTIVRRPIYPGVCALGEDELVRCFDLEFGEQLFAEVRGQVLVATLGEIYLGNQGQVWLLTSKIVRGPYKPALTNRVERVPVDDAVGFEPFDSDHCIRRAEGSLLCSGYGTHVELSPGPVAGLPSIVELALGNGFACARSGSGKVHCWGIVGDQGQLGDGRGQASLTPVEVVGIDDAVDIFAGLVSACAVRASGSVECWGDLQDSMGTELGAALKPKQVPGFEDAVQAALAGIGDDALCVRHQDATVSCLIECTPPWNRPVHTELRRIKGLEGVLHITDGFVAIAASGPAREWVHWDTSCGEDHPPDRLRIDGLRGVDLHHRWRCADVADERGPTCWGWRIPEYLGAHVEKPGRLFPFFTAP